MRHMSIGQVVDSHMDHELAWMVSERRASLFQENEIVKRGRLCSDVGRLVGEVMIERLGDEVKDMNPEEFERVGLDAISTMTQEVFDGKAEAVTKYVTEACVVYAISRSRGAKSAYTVTRSPGSDYWPFGMEGGFCNPRKLKLLDD